MTTEDLIDLIDRCGADPALWPPGARAGAERALAASPEARSVLEAMRRVERTLAATRGVDGARDFAAPALRQAQPRAVRLWKARAGWAAAAAAALSLGVFTGARTGAAADEPAVTLDHALALAGEVIDAG